MAAIRSWSIIGTASLLITMCSRVIGHGPAGAEKVAVISGTVIGIPDVFGGEIPGSDEGKPVAGAVVRAAIPATDMQLIRTRPTHPRFETTTDGAGRYRLLLPLSERDTPVSLDAFAPGFRSFAGSNMLGGDSKELRLDPESTFRFDFKLPKALYVAGLVVDRHGNHVAGVDITALIMEPDGYGYITQVQNARDGKFEVFDFPASGIIEGRGVVVFQHPSFRRIELPDVYALTDAKRKSLRVVLNDGRTVKGRVLTQGGEPLAGVMVEATFDERNERKAVITNENGVFMLRGLPQARCALVAHAMDRGEKAKHPLELTRDYDGLELQLKAVQTVRAQEALHIIGMELVDLNKDLRDLYDVSMANGVLVLDPGKDHAHLNIGRLVKGDCFWLVGDTQVTSVRGFISAILRNVERRDDGGGTCRVVYWYRRVDSIGTNTQHMELTVDDLRELEKVQLDLDLENRGEGRKQKERHPIQSGGEGAVGGGDEAEDGRALNKLWRK